MKFNAMVISATLVLAGCAVPQPSKVQQSARQFIGKPVQAAIQAFGPPNMGNGSTILMWNHTSISDDPYLTWVQTGKRYTGTSQVGQTQAGSGVGSVPIYQDNYEAVGEYRRLKTLHYLCDIIVDADARSHIITSVDVIGCSDSKDGT
ncbi:hypothetical protein [Burkholderia gladioli]|uniref:hypothetical protein n=1 Tax=Burkholderia gladioli TaxID=28095 RepID=UPI001640CFEE|nr:hypothetical protein [Burkholderia gladioli]